MTNPKPKDIKINREWCKGCNICVHFCPNQVLELDEDQKVRVIKKEACICCKMCELRCPDLAIEVIAEDKEKGK